MLMQIEELVSEHGLELPSPDTEEYWLLDIMDPQQVLSIVTLCAEMEVALVVPLRFMLKQTPSLLPLVMGYRLKGHISTALTSLASSVANLSSTPESEE